MAGRDRVFVSYRRSDASASATAIRQLLTTTLGEERVFQDVAGIDLGEPFPQALRDELARACVMLVLIGSGWLAAKDQYDRRRIDDPADWVHIEIASALADAEIVVIPVLVDDVRMFPAEALPGPLQALAERQTVRLRHEAWDTDAAPLVARLVELFGMTSGAPGPSPAPAPPEWVWCPRIPRRPRHIVGRDDVLGQLARAGEQSSGSLAVWAVCGTGGIGKTTVATEYVWRQRDRSEVVWWVRADQALTLVSDLCELGTAVLPAREQRGDERAEVLADQVVAWLEATSRRWVVVFDNAHEPRDVDRWIPTAGPGQVIITSRYPDWTALADVFSLELLGRKEAMALLTERVERANPVAAVELDSMGQVADRIDGLPLALEQAGAYVAQHSGRRFAGYLRLLDDVGSDPFPDDTRPLGYDANAFTTWQVSIDAATEDAPLAAKVLGALGFVSPDAIPAAVFLDGEAARHPYLTADVDRIDEALDALAKYALIRRDDTISLHRIVQDAARRRAGRDAYLFVTAALKRAFPDSTLPSNWPGCAALVPHVLAAARFVDPDSAEDDGDLWWVLDDVGLFLRRSGAFDQAVVVHRDALAIAERFMEPDGFNLGTARASLASSYRSAGRFDDAIPIEEQVIVDRERQKGADDAGTINARAALATSYWAAGRVAEAIPIEERVLADRERLFGADHADTITARANLAASYRAANRVGEAIPMEERVVADRVRLQGDDHVDTITARANLAASYRVAGRADEAIPMEERVVADRIRILGADHPDTITARANLADSYKETGRLDEAIALQETVAADYERVLGPEHPYTLAGESNLAVMRAARQP